MPDCIDECALLDQLRQHPDVFEAIAAARGPELKVQAELRKQWPADVVRAALEISELRGRAAGKFSRAARMWLSRKGLEQSTPEAVALHKATRFARVPNDVQILDLCCGIGSDAIALAREHQVLAVDADPAACLRTRMNAEVYEVASRLTTQTADVRSIEIAGRYVHIDPDRRSSKGRTIRLEQYEPDLAWLQTRLPSATGAALKVSPASNFGGKFPEAEVELVSLGGECKEATIWFGELRSDASWRATVLPAGETIAGHPLAAMTNVQPHGRFLYDPDPAVVRAGLVDLLAERLGLWRLDDAEEYLSGDALVESPFVTPFEVTAVLPNNDREIRRAVRESGWGQVEIKCRHVPIQAEAVRRKLPLTGGHAGTLVYARMSGRTRVVLCSRLDAR